MSPYSHSSWLLELYCISWFHGTLHRRTRNNSFAHLLCCSKKILPYLPFLQPSEETPYHPLSHRLPTETPPSSVGVSHTIRELRHLLWVALAWTLFTGQDVVVTWSQKTIDHQIPCVMFFSAVINEIDISTCDNHVIHFLGLDQVS